jgi:hypothetical protein
MRVIPADCFVTLLLPVSAIIVTPTPEPRKCTAFVIESPDQLHDPPGTCTMSP